MSFKKPQHESSAQAATRQLLIEAAARVFAERGFNAASVREICTQAGANVAAVNYHFGDKEGLYAEVLKYALRCAREKYPPDSGLKPGATCEERLRAFIHSFLLRIFDEGPQACHGKLLSREMIEPTSALDSLVEEEMRPMSHQLQSIVRGLLGAEAPEEMVRRSSMSVISQIVFYHHCRPVTRRLYPKLEFNSKEIDRLADHIAEFSLAALKQMARNLKGK
jgi:TetR/AcrR family transcriptional regulator, regulator of cefoperazone and chloramphenicol sensitivity